LAGARSETLEDDADMAIVITGAAGFIGLNLLERCLAAGREVVAVDRSPLPATARCGFAALPGRLVFRQLDVTDAAAIADLLDGPHIERVVHAAAVTADAARERVAPRAIVDINIGGVATVMEAVARRGVERIVVIGSIAAYGGLAGGQAVGEDGPKHPSTLYELGKFTGEGVALRLGELFELDVVVARLGTVFGPWEHASGVRDTPSPIHQLTAAAWRGEAAVLPRPGGGNWHYAGDAADGLYRLTTAQRCAHRVYNLGSPSRWRLLDWGDKLSDRFPGFRVTVDPSRATVDLYGDADPGRMAQARFRNEFPTATAHDLDAAFAAYVDHLHACDGFGMTR
jgi:nucleoside-diphosphate-sugar epimerase